ncbi:MAG TPA: arabinose ABC transporter permease, partial [Verrucomicrobiae bacterium]
MPDRTAAANQGRNYQLLLSSQFLSAFGDNLILMIILGPFLAERVKGTITGQSQSIANIYYTSLLFVPYVLLAPFAGYLNDRFSKNRWLLGGNFIKLLGAAVTAFGVTSDKAWLAVGYFIVG